jgi:hypothetical protein
MTCQTERTSEVSATEMLHLPSVSMTSFTKANPLEVCHFLRLPREIRDMIYRMLLTTKYCTQVAQDRLLLKFRLCTAILLANKRISTEATRVLREENDFIILKVTGMHLDLYGIPAFRRLAEENLINPVLCAEVGVEEHSHLTEQNTVTLITTADAMPAIIKAIWILRRIRTSRPFISVYHGDLKLSLHFSHKASARYEQLSNLVLEPWTRINGLKTLVLTGDVKDPMRERLQDHILKGPFPDEVSVCLRGYILSAERESTQNNYWTAQWWWTILENYLTYLFELRPHQLGGAKLSETDNGFRNVLRGFLSIYLRSMLEQVKTYLSKSLFALAGSEIIKVLSWANKCRGYFDYAISPILEAKFRLCIVSH